MSTADLDGIVERDGEKSENEGYKAEDLERVNEMLISDPVANCSYPVGCPKMCRLASH
jgi:hypothetical protein